MNQTLSKSRLSVVKEKSSFHEENTKKYLVSQLNVLFSLCLLRFTLGLTILANVRKVKQVYVVILLKCSLKF